MTAADGLPSVVSATRLSNGFLGKLIEICFVTADYRRTMEGLVRFDRTMARVHVRLVIMQPLYGPSIFQEFLDEHGEGIQHVAFDCEERTWGERIAEFTDRGFPLVQAGRFMDLNAPRLAAGWPGAACPRATQLTHGAVGA
jgi:hypothetical protein